MSQARPALTVDVNMGGPGGRNISGKAAAQARASAQAPLMQQQSNGDPMNTQSGNVISEEDLIAQEGFSSDEEGQAGYQQDMRPAQTGTEWRAARGARNTNESGEQGMDGQYLGESGSSDGEEYGQREGDVDMGSEEEDGMYEEDEEDEMSSSPSIPDENIDFDLVYALHNFIATVEGQATVNKGNSLTLLDDSNSYWWLVRVLRTQEVGYIPAENIETPFERLARLNKHRNVDLTSATDDDHIQVPEKIFTSHLIKQRSFGTKGFSAHSGKLSALSRRNDGPLPSQLGRQSKRGVQFGPPTYLEHSGNEMSDEEDYDEDEEYEEDGEEEDEEEEEEEGDADDQGQRGDETNVQSRRGLMEGAATGVGAAVAGVAAAVGLQGYNKEHQQQQQQQSQPQTQQQQYLSQMEPDDGMDWDAQEAERVQREQEQRNEARNLAEQKRIELEAQQRQQQQQRYNQLMQRQQQAQQMQTQPGPVTSDQSMGSSPVRPRRRSSQDQRSIEQQPAINVTTPPATSDRNGFLPSQVQASRDRAGSDASSQQGGMSGGSSVGRASPVVSPDSKREKRASQRRSKVEDDTVEEKQGKKRSGVFSGLFSRSKDKKDRKSGNFGQQTGGSADGDSVLTTRSSEDSTTRRSLTSFSPGQSMGMGKAVQERDRAVQEAYQRQFLQDPRRDQGERSARPGSLIGTPATVPMLNVLRIFASTDLDTDATFKTVLLNESTTSHDLVKQAMQRFRLGVGHSISDYVLTVKLVEGDERVLNPTEKPLRVFDQLTETLAASNKETATIPSVKRSSVGSISSVSSNLSMHPAIARLGNDFSDDHEVKFYLNRKQSIMPDATPDHSFSTMGSNGYTDSSLLDTSGNTSLLGVANDSIDRRNSRSSNGSADTQDTIQANNLARFALRLLIFPSDLPEGTVFDPQTNAVIPEHVLAERGPTGPVPGEGVEQQYREKILALPKNTTVAEVIEQGLDRFGIAEGVVEGGDDVEERGGRRRSNARIRYGLCIDVNNAERSLLPTSKVVEAYPSPPIYRAGPVSRRGMEPRRRSQDSAMLLSMAEELRPADPVFILRQVHSHKSKTVRALSPTEDVLLQKQDQRRQAELETVAPTPSAGVIEEARSAMVNEEAGQMAGSEKAEEGDGSGDTNTVSGGTAAAVGAAVAVAAGVAVGAGTAVAVGAAAAAAMLTSSSAPSTTTTTASAPVVATQGMTRQEIITAQRAAAQERRAAVLGAQRNESQGSDSTQALGTLADSDFGLEHLYAVVDAAARRKPIARGKKGFSIQQSSGSSYDFKPTVAGLFPPPAPIISDKRVKDIYLPIGKHLNSLEDSLDQLLNDAVNIF